MGMFDKDKEIGTIVTSWIPLHTPFVLFGARITRNGDYPTKMGLASQVTMNVARLDSPGDRYDVTSLASAICAKAREAELSDFPAVVQLAEVPSPTYGGNALVLQFLKAWTGGRNTNPAEAPAPAEDTPHKAPPRAPDPPVF